MKSTPDEGTPLTPQGAAESHAERFDFDQWAVAVKRQMIASLKRKGIA